MRRHAVTAVALAVIVVTAAVHVSAQQGYDTFQRALAAEKSEGNLNAAIRLYQQTIREAGTDRALAARAWLRIGECYRRMGDAQARDAYLQVVKRFPDQADVSDQARARIASLTSTAPQGQSARLIGVQDGQIEFDGHITQDHLGGTDWFSGDVVLRDLTTGRLLRPVKGGGGGFGLSAWGENPRLSPDGTQLAYQWFGEQQTESHQLRLLSMAPGSEPRVLLHDYPRVHNPYPIAWSADGRAILIGLELAAPPGSPQPEGQGDFQFGWITLANGAFKPFHTVDWWRSGGQNSLNLVSVSPDGRYLAFAAFRARGSDAASAPVAARVRGSEERSIFVVPTSGGAAIEVVKGGVNESPLWAPNGRSLVFVSNRGVGTYGLWTLPIRNGTADGPVSLLRRDLGRVRLHGLTSAGSLYYTSEAGIDEVFVTSIAPDGRIADAGAHVLDTTAGRLPVWSPDGRRLALRRLRADENHDVVIRTIDGGEELKWAPPGTAASAAGRPMWLAADVLQPIGNSAVRLQIGADGITETPVASRLRLGAVSPDRRLVFVPSPPASPNKMRNGRIAVYDTATGQERQSFDLREGVAGLAVNRDGSRLAVTTPGLLAIVGTDGTGLRELYRSPTMYASPHRVGWSADGRWVLFTQDDSNGRSQVMRISASGGKPEPIGLTVDSLSGFDISPDGSRIAYSARRNATEIWALELASVLPPK